MIVTRLGWIAAANLSLAVLTGPVFAQSSDPTPTVQLNPLTTIAEFEGQVGEAFTIRRADQPAERLDYQLLLNGEVADATQYRYDNLLGIASDVGASPYEVIVLPQTGTYQLQADSPLPTVTVTPATSYERIMAKANSTPTDEPARIDRAIALYTDAIRIAPEAIEPYVRRIGLNLIARQELQFYSPDRDSNNEPNNFAAELYAHYQMLPANLQAMVRADLDAAAALVDANTAAALYISALNTIVTTGELPAELADQLLQLSESTNQPSAAEATSSNESTAEEF
ncbi:MAG: hypothetical protein ACFB0C_14755 [Leptolyngbyaceae cyanobacterium]